MNRMLISVRIAVLAVLFSTGCGSSEPTGPKETITEVEQEQVQEFQHQRQKEWEGTKGE